MDMSSLQVVSLIGQLFLLMCGTGAQQVFRSEPKNLTVRMGATAVLRCEVLRASGTVQWVKDGLLLGPERSLPGFPRYSMIGNLRRGQYNLQIENVQLDDDAAFNCQAGRSEKSEPIISNLAWINVLIPPSEPYFEMDMLQYWVAGKKYSVICVVPDAKPEAEITLYKDGVELTGAESFTMSGSKDKLLNTRAQVTITALISDNGRQLSCHAKNSAHSSAVQATMTMNVYFPPQPPVILGLERQEVRAGTTLVLECVCQSGNPLANLQWTKDGEVVLKTWEEDAMAHTSKSVLYLKIRPADNQAVLGCESANLVSASPLSTSRTLTVIYDPAEVKLLGSFVATEGEELNLNCFAASSNPPVQIRWWLGNKELNSTAVIMEEGENGGMTTLSNLTYQVSKQDNGMKLSCEAFNRATKVSKIENVEITVYYPPQKVWIDGPSQDIPLFAGTKVRLVCFSTGGNPPGNLHWYKNGKPVQNAFRSTSFDKGVTRELPLVLSASDNMAFYHCDATNEAKKTISAKIRLQVLFPAISMKITANADHFYQGQTVTLECNSGSSNPKSNISWSLGTQRFQGVDQPHRKAEYGGFSVSSLLSLNVSSQLHNQRVICQSHSAELPEGAKTFLKLNVLYPPEFSSDQPTQVQVVEDYMATIPLLVSANPEEVSCVWQHRRELVKGRDVRFHWPNEFTLEIENVTRREAGSYKIECTNQEGVSHTTVLLDVLYAPSVKAERDPVYVNLGDTADLICVADANPIISDMFSWKWLGEEEVEEMGEETQEDESSLLTIHGVTRAHAGFYQCIANNGIAPPGSTDVQLVVQFKPIIQKGPQWRKVASRGDGTTTAELACRAEGIPNVDFIWEKNHMLMDFENPRYEERTVREGSFHTSTIQVVNVSALLDYAVFRCTARNSLGDDALDIQLLSTNHPDPPSSFRLVSVSYDSVTLEWIPGFDGGLTQRFRVRYHWDKSASFLYMDVFPPGEATFTVTGLLPNTTYNFSVNAINAIGESGYADNNAVLTITTMDWPEMVAPTEEAHISGAVPTYLTVVFTVVFGVLLVVNSLGCFFGLKWRKKQGHTGGVEGTVPNGAKKEEEGSIQSTVSNKYESREKINKAAQRTLIIDSGSETDSNLYESYATEGPHYYYPNVDYRPPVTPHPEEIHRPDHTHLYEEVKDLALYQDVPTSPLPPLPPSLDQRLPHQRNEWKLPVFPPLVQEQKPVSVQQAPKYSELPFELRGELV